MTREEWKALAQDYASGAMTPEERAAFEAELPAASARGWGSDLAEAMESAAMLVRALPPEQVGSHVWQSIAQEMGSTQTPMRRMSRLWAAAAIVAVAVTGWKMRMLSQSRDVAEQSLANTTSHCASDLSTLRAERDHALQAREEAEKAVAMAADARTRVVQLEAHGTTLNARVLWNEAEHRAVVVASGPAAEQGKDYELWVIRGDKKLPAGLIHPVGGQAFAMLDASLVQAGADVLAITLEAAGGAPQPAGPIILVGKI